MDTPNKQQQERDAAQAEFELQADVHQSRIPLTDADGIAILGAAFFFLRDKDVCRSLSEMHANNAAQGTVLKLRHEQWRKTYGRSI